MEKLKKFLGLVGYAVPEETIEMRNDNSSKQTIINKIRITNYCKICSIEQKQRVNFDSNKELKNHVKKTHSDSIYYDLAMELIP